MIAFRALIKRDLRLFFSDRRAVLISFVAPICIASFFGYIFGGGRGSDDAARVPVLFFYTGGHSDYHKPSDTADKLDAAGMARVASIGARVVERLAGGARPVYAQVARPARRQGQNSAGSAAGSALLGVVAVPRPGSDGLRLSSIMPGSGAERAGLREGDVIVRFAGSGVDGLEELRALIRDRKPGDSVSVLYLRDGEAHATSATLGPRVD